MEHGLRSLLTRKEGTTNRNPLFWIMTVFAMIGLAVSAYLAYLSSTPPASCPIGDFGILSCNEVLWSEYSHFFGISVALLGLGWFAIIMGLIALAWRNRRFVIGIVVWSLLGAFGVAAFVYTELFLLRSICPLCTIAHLCGLAILILSIATARSTR